VIIFISSFSSVCAVKALALCISLWSKRC